MSTFLQALLKIFLLDLSENSAAEQKFKILAKDIVIFEIVHLLETLEK